jgi:CRP-like cAMP-binding protein
MRANAKMELLRSVPLFAHCTKKELQALAREADELDVAAGTTLTQEGAHGREFLVIVEGSAEVRRNGRRINRLGDGDFLGEIALLSGAPRTATVTTTSDTHLLVLTDRAFRRVADTMPSVQGSLMHALAERLAGQTV